MPHNPFRAAYTEAQLAACCCLSPVHAFPSVVRATVQASRVLKQRLDSTERIRKRQKVRIDALPTSQAEAAPLARVAAYVRPFVSPSPLSVPFEPDKGHIFRGAAGVAPIVSSDATSILPGGAVGRCVPLFGHGRGVFLLLRPGLRVLLLYPRHEAPLAATTRPVRPAGF